MFQLKSHLTNLCFVFLIVLVVGVYPVHADANAKDYVQQHANLPRLIVALGYVIGLILFFRTYFLAGRLSFVSLTEIRLKTKVLYIKIAFLFISFLLYSGIFVFLLRLSDVKVEASTVILALMILSFCMGSRKAAKSKSEQFSNKEMFVKTSRCFVLSVFFLLGPYLFFTYIW